MANKRIKRHFRIRNKVRGTEVRPRLAVYRSSKNIQVQLINDDAHITLVGMSTLSLPKSKVAKTENAKKLGEAFAKKVLEIENGKYKKIVFDRGGYKYHGRVRVLADTLRENGLEF